MKIKLIVVGKMHQPFLALVEQYLKRCGRFQVAVELIELKENKKVEEKILTKAEKDFLILLDENGQEKNSRELAEFFDQKMMDGWDLALVIGGADGHSEELKQRADFLLSLSQLTLPHELATVVCAETIYRSLSISNGHPYHRGIT